MRKEVDLEGSLSGLSTNRQRKFKFNIENKNNMKFVNNYIVTSKYNLINFIPKNLFLQFQRLSNIYFLLLGTSIY